MPSRYDTIGNLTIPHLFLDVRSARTTGTATFERGDVAKKVYVEDGDVIFASSNQQDDRLGECLCQAEIISKVQLDASTEIVEKSKVFKFVQSLSTLSRTIFFLPGTVISAWSIEIE